jgi:hypothetical protein
LVLLLVAGCRIFFAYHLLEIFSLFSCVFKSQEHFIREMRVNEGDQVVEKVKGRDTQKYFEDTFLTFHILNNFNNMNFLLEYLPWLELNSNNISTLKQQSSTRFLQ